ncbi:T9SS type A sorting domain-containing protein [Fluviicola taffensis]|uniref:T9SS type A sorting domain-containing protein n=1 Tax=Fluviicola taffensis TaxID=191579 RepID=UPI003137A1F2
MKKIYLSALFAGLGTLAAFGQDFYETTYRGAFAPAPTAMWTEGWANWDPQNTNYGTPNQTISTNITANTTWTAGNVYLLQGQIYVKNNATLTIEPGTIIMGDKAVLGSGLFITKGAKLMAQGTVNAPIVFTSNQAVGSRSAGDWGGIILLGKGVNNQANGVANIEGLAPTTDTEFGGGMTSDNADNSGKLTYVRIEFPGYAYQTDKEINGLTLGSVGSGTEINFVQVSFSNDDAFEWFGGAVNAKHLVSYRNLDDDFDTDFGYSGNVQFGLIVRDPNIADNPAVSTSEGFESDNDATGSANTPQTNPTFTNVTAIGPYRGNTANTIANGYRRGARIRKNSAIDIRNSIFMDFQRGIFLDGTACEANATGGLIIYKNNIVAGNAVGKVTERAATSTYNVQAWFAAGMNDSIASTAGILTTPYNYLAPDYRPAASSPLLTGADFTGMSVGLGIKEVSAIAGVSLYPNPTSGITSLFVDVAQNSTIEVVVMNANGQVMQTVATKYAEVGTHEFTINATDFAQGLYYAVVRTGDAVKTVKLSVVK